MFVIHMRLCQRLYSLRSQRATIAHTLCSLQSWYATTCIHYEASVSSSSVRQHLCTVSLQAIRGQLYKLQEFRGYSVNGHSRPHLCINRGIKSTSLHGNSSKSGSMSRFSPLAVLRGKRYQQLKERNFFTISTTRGTSVHAGNFQQL